MSDLITFNYDQNEINSQVWPGLDPYKILESELSAILSRFNPKLKETESKIIIEFRQNEKTDFVIKCNEEMPNYLRDEIYKAISDHFGA